MLLRPPPNKLDAALSTVLPIEDPPLDFAEVFWVIACVLSCSALTWDCWIEVRLLIWVVREVNCSVTSEVLLCSTPPAMELLTVPPPPPVDEASCPSNSLRDGLPALLAGRRSSHLLRAIVAFRPQFFLQDKDRLHQPRG